MRRLGRRLSACLLLALCASCASSSVPPSRSVERSPRLEARVDAARWGSILWLDVEALLRIDASAPRERLLRDVIGADPFLNALLPDGWRSLADLRAIEYRAERFAGSRWTLLITLEQRVEDFLEARGAVREARGFRLSPASETLARAVAPDELQVADASLLADARVGARLRPPFDLSAGMIGAWRIPRARAQRRGQPATTPEEVTMVALRAAGRMLVRIEASGRYEDEAAARRGWAYWEGKRRRLASSVAMQLAGLARPISEGRLALEGETIVFRTAFDATELRLVLAVVARLPGRPEAPPLISPG